LSIEEQQLLVRSDSMFILLHKKDCLTRTTAIEISARVIIKDVRGWKAGEMFMAEKEHVFVHPKAKREVESIQDLRLCRHPEGSWDGERFGRGEKEGFGMGGDVREGMESENLEICGEEKWSVRGVMTIRRRRKWKK
jgi:hypothetical protein